MTWCMPSWTQRRLVDPLMRAVATLGRDVDGIQVLEVRGRRSGRLRRTPVKVLEVDGARYLVSLFGASGWALNLRAEPRARLRLGRRIEQLMAIEVADEHKPTILAAYLAGTSRTQTRELLAGTGGQFTEADLRRQAPRIPVFRLVEGAQRVV
jgi:deazaflavin-dependent oxidoreductase (nitroreductase family)